MTEDSRALFAPGGGLFDPWPVDRAEHINRHLRHGAGTSVLGQDSRHARSWWRRRGYRLRCRLTLGHCWHVVGRIPVVPGPGWFCCECPAGRAAAPIADCTICPPYAARS